MERDADGNSLGAPQCGAPSPHDTGLTNKSSILGFYLFLPI